jgi:hypothetical protein
MHTLHCSRSIWRAKRPGICNTVKAPCLRCQLGDKLLPRFAALLGESSKTVLDALAVAEKTDLLVSADAFIAARKLRNALVHEYMHDAQTFLESLFEAQQACQMFFAVIQKAEAEIVRLGVTRPVA